MLDGLNQIEWTGLSHAYNSPEDVPYLLHDLASADPEKAEHALDNIVVSLFHQGTVYESTVPAVPFLVELAQTAPHQRPGIIDLLGGFLDIKVSYGEPIDQVRAGVLAHATEPDGDRHGLLVIEQQRWEGCAGAEAVAAAVPDVGAPDI